MNGDADEFAGCGWVWRFNDVRNFLLLAGVGAFKAKLCGWCVVAHFKVRLVRSAHAGIGCVLNLNFQGPTDGLYINTRDVGLQLPCGFQVFGEQRDVGEAVQYFDDEFAVVGQRRAFDFNACPAEGFGA